MKAEYGVGNSIMTADMQRVVDAIRAFEMLERNLVQVSAPMEFAGPITALWMEASGSSLIAVSKNAATGNYEAYRVAVACGQ